MSKQQIIELLQNQKQFKIRLPHYDGGSHIFWPEYRWSAHRVMRNDVVAAWLGDDIEMGLVTAIDGDLVSMDVIGRQGSLRHSITKVAVKIHRNRVSAIMHPE